MKINTIMCVFDHNIDIERYSHRSLVEDQVRVYPHRGSEDQSHLVLLYLGLRIAIVGALYQLQKILQKRLALLIEVQI